MPALEPERRETQRLRSYALVWLGVPSRTGYSTGNNHGDPRCATTW